jgi:signal peptidase II
MSSATLLLCMIASFLLDQASKAFALALDPQPRPAWYYRPFLRCSLNTDITLGVFGRSGVMIALWCAEVAALLILVQFVSAFGGLLPTAALGLALGGAAGNLLDRVRRGGVVDFIDLGRWPMFNLADVAIVVGVGVAVLAVI